MGLPTATSEVGEDAVIYEPFMVFYQGFDSLAVNFSAALEIEDPLDVSEESEVGADLAIGLIKPSRRHSFVYLLELGASVESDETNMRVAPGFYWQPPHANWELGASLPIGLTEGAPDIGAFVQFTIEYGGDADDLDAFDDD